MYLVAIGELHGPIDDAIAPLARDLATTAYDLRLLANAGFPAVVLATTDETAARAAMATIARLGHEPVYLDRRTVTPSAQMTLLRDFELKPGGLAPHAGSSDRLNFADVAVLLRATHRVTSETTQTVTERKLRPVMAVATGGLVLSQKTSRTVTSATAQIESVLYLFRSDGAPPWLLRERGARYGGLGTQLRPTSMENFATTIRLIRDNAPAAVYDERLMNSRPMRGVAEGIQATDLFAHLLASFYMSRSTSEQAP